MDVKTQGCETRVLPDGATLNRRQETRLVAYAIAAAGALSLGPQAAGQVVYTAADIAIDGCGTKYDLDINNDGIADFRFALKGSNHGDSFTSTMTLAGNRTTNAQVIGNQENGPAVLSLGTEIGPDSSRFVRGPVQVENVECFAGLGCVLVGSWVDQKRQYLGLKFDFEGGTHFGWARLSVMARGDRHGCRLANGYITGYAYESQPDTAIKAGDTGGVR